MIRHRSTLPIIIVFIMMCAIVLASCGKKQVEPLQKVQVNYLGLPQDIFDIRYGNPITLGNMEIEVIAQPFVSNPDEEYAVTLARQLQQGGVDVVQTTGMALPLLVQENLLWPIETVLDMNTDGFAESIIQKIRNDSGDGFLYGLPTVLMSDVLYYNKELFDKHDLPVPKNGMSWSETLQLDRQLWSRMTEIGAAYSLLEAGDEPPAARLDKLISAYAKSEGIADFSNGAVTLDTTQWHTVWQNIINAYVSYDHANQSENAQTPYGNRELSFTNQSSALMIGGSYYWHNWMSSGLPDFEWGLATTPGTYNIYYQYELLAISNDSGRKDAAWRLIEYLTSEETTDRLLTETDDSHSFRGYTGRFPARIAQMEEKLEVDLSALYVQAPASDGLYVRTSNPAMSLEFHDNYRALRITHIEEVLNGSMTVQDALASLQQETAILVSEWE